MKAYLFQAALICEPCGIAASVGRTPDDEDSELFPQGPYSDGGGEADTPQHCDHCGLFLENPLTADGEAYVLEAVKPFLSPKLLWAETADSIDNAVLAAWMHRYSYLGDYGDDMMMEDE